jgi:hypothetical protein
MQLVSLGKIAVPTAGVPVAVTASNAMAKQVVFRSASGNAGLTKVLDSAGTLAAELEKPTAGAITDEFKTPVMEGNLIPVKQFSVDAATNGDNVIVSYWQE